MAAITKEVDAIFSGWLGLRIEQGVTAGTLVKYGAALALLFLLFGYWVYRLRREIGYRKAAEMRERTRSNIMEMLAKGAPLPEVLDAIARSVEQESDIAFIEQSASLVRIATERSAAADKANESAAHFRLLTEDVADVVWKTDRDLRFTYISPADERLRGYRADEVIGHHVFEMFTEEGIATVREIMRQRQEIERNGIRSDTIPFEVQHRCSDGRLLWGEVLVRPDRDAHGTIIGYHGITRETSERRQMQDQVRQLAFYDPLTDLPNRRLLNDRLNQTMSVSKRTGRYGAVMVLDLDNFKSLNDTQGHLVGDLLLIEAASRLKSCVREMDTVSRFGGDEFVVMLSDLNTDQAEATSHAGIIAEKIRISLSEPYLLTVSHDAKADATVEHCCSASIGVVMFIGNETSPDDVLKRADAAMYQAKDAGSNLIRFHDSKS